MPDPVKSEEVLTFNEIKIEETGCELEEQEEEILGKSDLNHMEEEEVVYEEDGDDLIEELQTEQESDDRDMYTCNLCQVNFYSVEDHVAQYHKDQQVIVEVEESGEGTSDDKPIKVEIEAAVIYDEEYLIDEIIPELKKGKTTQQKPKKVKPLCYTCPFCPAKYSNSRAVTAHVKIHKNPKPFDANTIEVPENFVCDVCHTIFTTNKSLRLHVRMHDPVKPRTLEDASDYDATTASNSTAEMFTCDVCNKSYDVQFREMHILSHSDGPKFNCSICNKKFKNQINLTMHLKAHQETRLIPSRTENTNTPYACGYCGRQFARPHEKVKHERIHTGEKPHGCDICGKTFRVSYCLTLHMRTHAEARPYVCPTCNKRFKAHSVYNHHLMTHSDVRNFQCPYCPKAFKTSVQLAGHKNSHTKPFSCNDCNRPFATLYAVRAHMETHKKANHNLKHKCNICGATYARNFALRDHIKEQHADAIEVVDMDGIKIDLLSKRVVDEVEISIEDHTEMQEQEEEQIIGDEQIISDYDHFEGEEVVCFN